MEQRLRRVGRMRRTANRKTTLDTLAMLRNLNPEMGDGSPTKTLVSPLVNSGKRVGKPKPGECQGPFKTVDLDAGLVFA